MALSRAGLNSLGVVANYFKKNPVYALNAINDIVNTSMPPSTKYGIKKEIL